MGWWAWSVVFLAMFAAPAFGQRCATCHADPNLMERLVGDSAAAMRLGVDPATYEASVHGRLGLPCTSCHARLDGYPHGDIAPADCSFCHGEEERRWASSIHGRPHPRTATAPASCADCHGSHDVQRVGDPRSHVYRLTRFETCATCHSNPERMAVFGQKDVERVQTYLNSVHGRALVEKGLAVVAICTDCHAGEEGGAHGIDRVSQPTSLMNRANVVETCGTCHVGIRDQYNAGIHGQAFAQGSPDAPTCVDCHTEHAVQPVASPQSSVYPTHVVQTCSACHEREELNERYGLPPGRRSTFLGTFHGIALVSGQLTVANCASCHGAHAILPSSDPRSSIHPANLVRTCGSCHPGIGEGVAEGRIHLASVREINGFALLVQWFYYLLIAGTVLFAVVMIFLDQYRHRVVDARRRGGRDA